MQTLEPGDPEHDLIARWFQSWDAQVRALDYAGARAAFTPDVAGFGTFEDVVSGLDRLEAEQWRSVWPTIRDFRFRTDRLSAGLAADGSMAFAAVPWTSTGFDAGGRPFPRNGRATVVLARTAKDAPWRGVHTHFSLNRGVPQRSHGAPD